MADICDRCGKIIEISLNKKSFEKPDGEIATIHLDCNEKDFWENEERRMNEVRKEEMKLNKKLKKV